MEKGRLGSPKGGPALRAGRNPRRSARLVRRPTRTKVDASHHVPASDDIRPPPAPSRREGEQKAHEENGPARRAGPPGNVIGESGSVPGLGHDDAAGVAGAHPACQGAAGNLGRQQVIEVGAERRLAEVGEELHAGGGVVRQDPLDDLGAVEQLAGDRITRGGGPRFRKAYRRVGVGGVAVLSMSGSFNILDPISIGPEGISAAQF